MDTVLEQGPFIIIEGDYNADGVIYEKASIWVVDGEFIRPSTNLSISTKLPPGTYQVGMDRNMGVYCQKASFESDELYKLPDSIIGSLLDEINLFWDKKELYKENNLVHKRGILLEGYHGTGKTSIITMLSEEIIKRKGIVFKVTGPSNFNAYVEFITNHFRSIETETPIITIIEDLDKYGDSEEFLDFLDGKSSINHHVVITTSNDTSLIPDAFLRPSRIDLKVEIPLPSKEIRESYFKFKKVPEEDLETLVELSKNLSLADLKEIYITVYMLNYSIEDAVKKVTEPRSKKKYSSSKSSKTQFGI